MTRRLVVSYLAITIFVLLILELPLALFFQRQQFDRLISDLERDTTVLGTLYEDVLERDLPADPADAFDYSAETGARVVVVDASGISLVDTGAANNRDLSTRPEFEEALAGRHATGTRHSETLETELAFAAVPIASGGTVHGAIRVTFDSDHVRQRVRRFWYGLAAVAVVVTSVMGAIGWVVARSLIRPVRRLQATAVRFASGDLSPSQHEQERLPEIIALEGAMNAMAEDLDDLLQRQRRFVADASHQLRTPLTALRLRLENSVSEEENPQHVEELNRAIDETDRLGHLIGDLLMLARAERPHSSQPAVVSATARDRVDTWTAVADTVAVTLLLQTPDHDIVAMTMAGGVEQILDNLLENSIQVSPPGTTITVSVQPNRRDVEIMVADQGPGLSDDDKEKAVERFWRANQTTPGTGLGLAIVERLATGAGGSVRLEDNHPQGLRVVVTLPAATRRESVKKLPTLPSA